MAEINLIPFSDTNIPDELTLKEHKDNPSKSYDFAKKFKNCKNYKNRKTPEGKHVYRSSVSEELLEKKSCKSHLNFPSSAKKGECELFGFLSRFSSVFHVFRVLRNIAFYKSYRNLNLHHLKCINDAAIILCTRKSLKNLYFLKRKKLLADALEMISVVFHEMPMLDPNNLIKILWDLLVFFFLLLQVIIYSLERSFDNEIFPEEIHVPFIYSTIVIVFIDILLIFNTKIVISGHPVKNRKAILTHYLKNYFFIDCLTLVCLLFKNQENPDFNLIFVFKILFCNPELSPRVRQIILKLGNTTENLYDLLILGASIFLAGHTIACLWHYIGFDYLRSHPSGNCWLKSRGIAEETWLVKYLYSIYWSITTMLSVGYGDITPQNENEILFTMVAMVYGCVILGYSLTSVGEILERRRRLASFHHKYSEKAKTLRIMAKDMKLSFELEAKIINYMDYYWEQEKKVDPEQENLIMNQLSSSLREQIYLETNVKHLRAIPVFKKYFSEKTLIKLAHKLRKQRFPPQELIYNDQSRDCSLYIVLDGIVETFQTETKASSRHSYAWETYSKSDYFGIREFFTGFRRRGGVRAKDFSTMYVLLKEDFLSVIKQDPSEYEKFCKIRDNLILYNQLFDLEIRCSSCGKYDHETLNCQFLKYSPNKFVVIGKYHNYWKNFRNTFIRNPKQKKINALKFLPTLIETINDYFTITSEFKDLKAANNIINETESLPLVTEKNSASLSIEDISPTPLSITNIRKARASLKGFPLLQLINQDDGNTNKIENADAGSSFIKVSTPQGKNSINLNMTSGNQYFKQYKSLDGSFSPSKSESGLSLRRISIMKNESAPTKMTLPIFMPMERMKRFKYYFPKFNAENVIFRMRVRKKLKSIKRIYNLGK